MEGGTADWNRDGWQSQSTAADTSASGSEASNTSGLAQEGELVNIAWLIIFAFWIILDFQFAVVVCYNFLSFAFLKYLNTCLQNSEDSVYR